jgi:hypothetical protein
MGDQARWGTQDYELVHKYRPNAHIIKAENTEDSVKGRGNETADVEVRTNVLAYAYMLTMSQIPRVQQRPHRPIREHGF